MTSTSGKRVHFSTDANSVKEIEALAHEERLEDKARRRIQKEQDVPNPKDCPEDKGRNKLQGSGLDGESRFDEQDQSEGSNSDSDIEEPESTHKKSEKKGKKGLLKDLEKSYEKATESFNDAGQKFTPMNMDEEMEEGFFDENGNYITRKAEDEETDAWLASVDWDKAKTYRLKQKQRDELDAQQQREDEKFNGKEILKEIATYLKDDETITKALKRLGAKQKKVPSWKKKQMRKRSAVKVDTSANKGKSNSNEGEGEGDMDAFLKLTDLCNAMVKQGFFEVYSEDKTSLLRKVGIVTQDTSTKSNIVVQNFKNKDNKSEDEPNAKRSKTENIDSNSGSNESNTVLWFHKPTPEASKDSEEGPFDSSQMLKWQESNHFSREVHVRKKGTENYYSINRVDFDIYI